MNLTIDIGNTCTKLVVFDEQEPVGEIVIDDNSWCRLTVFAARYDIEIGIYSTVRPLSEEVMEIFGSLPFPVVQLKPGVTRVPVDIKYSTPETLGPDRLAAVVGAFELSAGRDMMIIDAGTCITYDYVTKEGEYLGGNISPGVSMRLKSLNMFTGKLPLISLEGQTPEIGYSTETAIRSGVVHGVRHEITGYIEDFSCNHPDMVVFMTGGMDMSLGVKCSGNLVKDGKLVAKGLNKILLFNKQYDN